MAPQTPSAVTTAREAGRQALERWDAARPRNFYEATPALAALLRRHLGPSPVGDLERRLHAFGSVVATEIDPLVAAAETERSLPALAPRDGIGRDRQDVLFHASRRDAGRVAWASGMLATPPTRAGAFEQAVLLHLLAHAGEGGLACPAVCTAGLIRALRVHASPQFRDRFLPPLVDLDFDRTERGAQFLTEVQGGSDVGANAVVASPDEKVGGAWRISGEKWFCSVADADQFLVTARPVGAPAGTRGIACFLVPRLVDREPNGFRIERLKDKVGTRTLATGEITFDGALAFPLGALEDGYKIAIGVVLNTSRWLNAAASAAFMRRAYLEASTFSRHRAAFSQPVSSFPLVRENLAVMKAEAAAALASTLELTALVGAIDERTASRDDIAFHRFLVNANKFVTSLVATNIVRRGIEALGGNGTIEDFSPLPRLYRDAIVLESWEGTHNVLCAQVLRDFARLDLLEPVLARVKALPAASRVADALDDLARRFERAVADPEWGALHGRRLLWRLVRAVQIASLGEGEESEAAAELLRRRELVNEYRPEDDASYQELLERVLGRDADPA